MACPRVAPYYGASGLPRRKSRRGGKDKGRISRGNPAYDARIVGKHFFGRRTKTSELPIPTFSTVSVRSLLLFKA